MQCALVQCPTAVQCNLNDPDCLFRSNSNSLVVFVTYSHCQKTMGNPVIFSNILFRRPSQAPAPGNKVQDIFREISRKCIISYQPNINKKKEFEIIQFVSKPYFSKFHLLTGFMNLAWYKVCGTVHFQNCKHLQKSRLSCGVGVKI